MNYFKIIYERKETNTMKNTHTFYIFLTIKTKYMNVNIFEKMMCALVLTLKACDADVPVVALLPVESSPVS